MLASGLPRERYSVGLDEREGRALLLLASPRISELSGFLVEVGERLVIETDEAVGGSAQELGDTRRYRDAERRLGGPPTVLTDTVTARDDGRGTLRILRRAGG